MPSLTFSFDRLLEMEFSPLWATHSEKNRWEFEFSYQIRGLKRYHFYSTNKSGSIQDGQINYEIYNRTTCLVVSKT